MDLINDQNFYTMVKDLKDSMMQDAALKKMVDSALRDLVNS